MTAGESSDRLDVVLAVVMSVTAVLIAWTAFQGTVWASEATRRFNEAGAARVESAKDLANLNRELMTDQLLFAAYLEAITTDNGAAAKALRHQMRSDFGPLVDDWVEAGGPELEKSPLDGATYGTYASFGEALERSAAAETSAAGARSASDQRDVYAGIAVALALVLFFAGLAATTKRLSLKIAGASLAGVLLVGATVALLFQDVP